MKIKLNYVTNSSSTGFIIINKSDKELTLLDFVAENPQLIENFKREYNHKSDSYSQKNMLISAVENNCVFSPNSKKECIFGDEDGTLIGEVFDYILRNGGESKNFKWRLSQYYR